MKEIDTKEQIDDPKKTEAPEAVREFACKKAQFANSLDLLSSAGNFAADEKKSERGNNLTENGSFEIMDPLKDDKDRDGNLDDTDWERTSLTKAQEALLREMESNGEIEVFNVEPNLSDPEHAPLHIPTENSGEFLGEPGNSAFVPNSTDALLKMNEYEKSAVNYVDGYPDFTPFTTHDSQWGVINGQVEIPHMTDQRQNPTWDYGKRPPGTSHDPNYDLGNFAQADNALVEQLKQNNPNITAKDIEHYRKGNHLVWHECADGKTMQLIPHVIHDACRHSGGVSEMKYRMAWGDVSRVY